MNKASFNTWLFPSAFSDCIIKVSNVGGVSDENNDNDDDDDDDDDDNDDVCPCALWWWWQQMW